MIKYRLDSSTKYNESYSSVFAGKPWSIMQALADQVNRFDHTAQLNILQKEVDKKYRHGYGLNGNAGFLSIAILKPNKFEL